MIFSFTTPIDDGSLNPVPSSDTSSKNHIKSRSITPSNQPIESNVESMNFGKTQLYCDAKSKNYLKACIDFGGSSTTVSTSRTINTSVTAAPIVSTSKTVAG